MKFVRLGNSWAYAKAKWTAFDFFQRIVIILLLANLLISNYSLQAAIEAADNADSAYNKANEAENSASSASSNCESILNRLN